MLILVCLFACSNRQTNKKMSSPKFYIEKIWAKESPSYSKFQILQEITEWGNGRRLLSGKQRYKRSDTNRFKIWRFPSCRFLE